MSPEKVFEFWGPVASSPGVHLVRVLMAENSASACLSALRAVGMKKPKMTTSPRIDRSEKSLALANYGQPIWRDYERNSGQGDPWSIGFESLAAYYDNRR